MQGQRLRELREAKNMTRKELSQAVCIGESSLGFYERDVRAPGANDLVKLCEFFGVSSDYLLGLSSAKHVTAPPDLSNQQKNQVSTLHELINILAEKDFNAAYSRNCLPVCIDILTAINNLIASVDEEFSQLKNKHPILEQALTASKEQKIINIVQSTGDDPSEVAQQWIDVVKEYSDLVNCNIVNAKHVIDYAFSIELFSCLIGNTASLLGEGTPNK